MPHSNESAPPPSTSVQWSRWHAQRLQYSMPIDEVASRWDFDVASIIALARYGAVPLIWSPDESHFFFDRRDIEAMAERVRSWAADARAQGVSPAQLRAIWREHAEEQPKAAN